MSKRPVFVHCADCRHEWPAFYTPLTLDEAGMGLMKSLITMRCPRCASKTLFMGKSKTPAAAAEPPATPSSPANPSKAQE